MGAETLPAGPALSPGAVFLAVFVALFLLAAAVDLALNLLNRREALRHARLPEALAGLGGGAGAIDAETFAKSRAYALDRLRFDAFATAAGAAGTLLLLLSGILPWLDWALSAMLGHGSAQGAAFLGIVLSLQAACRLPLRAYATFRIEGRHGFNTMTWGLFWKDVARELALSLILGLPLLYALLAVMGRAGGRWWLWAFLLVLAFQVVLIVIYPVCIAPLFNRFKPMPDGALKESLLSLAARLRFPSRDIHVMDGSRRSLHSNAYFTGFGRFRRIVLFDTLLSRMDADELRGVLAHEIGHYRLGHVYRMLAVQVAALFLLFWLASRALHWGPLYGAFGFPAPAPGASGAGAVGLFLFLTVLSCTSLLAAPLLNLLSRRHEYQADAYAVAQTGDSGAMQSALLKLARENLSNLTPHPWYSAFHYSHPALAERIAALRAKPG